MRRIIYKKNIAIPIYIVKVLINIHISLNIRHKCNLMIKSKRICLKCHALENELCNA